MSCGALQPFLAIVSGALLFACAQGERRPTTPTGVPGDSAAPRTRPPPQVTMVLEPAGLSLTVAEGRCIQLGEREVCGHAELEPGALGAQLLNDGWWLPATALAIEEAEVTFEIGDGVEGLGPLEGEPSAYLRPGEHTHRLGRLGWVELGPGERGPTPELRVETYEHAATAMEGLLGAPRRRVLVGDDGDSGVPVAPEDALSALAQAWLTPGPDWWTRGVADYLALLAAHRAGALPGERAYAELMDRYARHRDHPGESPATAEGQVAADLGALVAFCADVELRIQRSSLVAVLQRSGDGPLSPEALLGELGRQHPELGERHRGRVARRGVIDLDGCLRRAGRQLLAHHVPRVDPARLLGVGALDPATVEVRERGSGPLRPGDVVRFVRGRAIRHAADIVFHLRDLAGRHRFSVSVQRGEDTIRTWLRMVPLGEDLPTDVRFTAAKEPEAEDDGDPFGGPSDDHH